MSKLGEQFAKANYFWLGVSAVLALLSHWVRSHRWRLMLEPLGHKVGELPSFLAVLSGYFMNFIIPRAGELVRCGLIQKMSKVPASTALGTVITERLIDVLILFTMIVVLLVVEFQRLSELILQVLGSKFQNLNALILLGIGLLLFVGIVGYLLWRNWARLLQNTFFLKVTQFVQGMIEGVLSLRYVPNKIAFIAYSLLIWVLYYLMAYVLFFCFTETAHLDLWFGYIVLVMGAIGMSAPVQGGVGAYHFLVGSVFALRAMTMEQGILIATFMHTAQAVIILVFGGIAFALSLVVNRQSNQN